jgi:hypothetical protein
MLVRAIGKPSKITRWDSYKPRCNSLTH